MYFCLLFLPNACKSNKLFTKRVGDKEKLCTAKIPNFIAMFLILELVSGKQAIGLDLKKVDEMVHSQPDSLLHKHLNFATKFGILQRKLCRMQSTVNQIIIEYIVGITRQPFVYLHELLGLTQVCCTSHNTIVKCVAKA